MRGLVLAILCVPAFAIASPSIEVVDHGTTVEVIGHEISAANFNVMAVRSRLQIQLLGNPQVPKIFPPDKTIRQIEIADGATARWLSVKLVFDHDGVASLAPVTKVSQVGDDLHLVIPRSAIKAAPEPKAIDKAAPAPKAETKPVEAAPLVAEVKPVAKPEVKTEAKPEPKPEPKPEAKVEANETKPEAEHEAKPTAAAHAEDEDEAAGSANEEHAPAPVKHATAAPVVHKEEPGTRLPTMIALGIAALGLGFWLLKKKRTSPAALQSIHVIAQRSLGNKARIVWLAAGPREMIVSVTAQQVRVLGQWKSEPAPATEAREMLRDIPRDIPRDISRDVPREIPREMSREIRMPAPRASSPAVSGLMRLRDRLPSFPGADEAPPEDIEPDAVWAKEILAATAGRR